MGISSHGSVSSLNSEAAFAVGNSNSLNLTRHFSLYPVKWNQKVSCCECFPHWSHFLFINTICRAITAYCIRRLSQNYLGHFPEVCSPARRETVAPVHCGGVSLSVVSPDHCLPLVARPARWGELHAYAVILVTIKMWEYVSWGKRGWGCGLPAVS